MSVFNQAASFKEAVLNWSLLFKQALFGPRLLVCVVLLCISGAIVSGYVLNFLWLLLPSAVGFAIGSISGKKKMVIIFSLLPILFFCYSQYRTPKPLEDDISKRLSSGKLVFEGQIQDITTSKSGVSTCLIVKAQRVLFPYVIKVGGKVEVTIYGTDFKFQTGDIVRISGNLSNPQPKTFPWQFDYASYLAKQKIFSICYAQSARVIEHQFLNQQLGWMNLFTAWIDSLRNKMLELHRKNLGQVDGDLLTSIVLGNRAVTLSDSVNQKYRDVGLSHVLAASGFNISLAVAMMWWLSKKALNNCWTQTILCWVSTLLYVLLAGASPSVIRAAVMITLVLFMKCLFRMAHAPALLATALLISVIIDPLSILDVGLQLSYLATIGIILGASPLEVGIAEFKIPNWLMEPLLLVLLAQASVLPVQLGIFWQIGLFFLPANLLVDPLVPIITILGFASSMAPLLDFGTGFLNTPAWLIDKLCWFPLKLMTAVVDYFSSFQGAKLFSRPPTFLAICIYFSVFFSLLACLHFRRFRVTAVVLWAMAVYGLFWHPLLPALTVGVFPRSIIIMNNHQDSCCLGMTNYPEAMKFSSFFGCKNLSDQNNFFSKHEFGALTIVDARHASIALLDLRRNYDDPIYTGIPKQQCQILIIHQQFHPGLNEVCYELGCWKMLIEKLQPQWIIVDLKQPTVRVVTNLLAETFPENQILNLKNGASILSTWQSNPVIFLPTNCETW